MDVAMIMYLEIDLLCIALILYVGVKSFKNIEERKSWWYFRCALGFILLSMTFDMFWELVQKDAIPVPNGFNYFVNAAYFVSTTAIAESWFLFTEYEIESSFTRNNLKMLYSSLPLWSVILMTIISAFNGCVFSIASDGTYVRGPLIGYMFLVPCAYLYAAAVHSVLSAFKKENYVNRRRLFALAGFAVVSSSFGLLQLFLPGTPMPSIGITIAVIMVYVNSLERMISIDPLTHINNRYQMERHLLNKMEHYDGTNDLYLIIVDLDRFKAINDSYGHVEGDRALSELSKILRQTAAKYNCFVSRYGGDEFIVIHETPKDKGLGGICGEINSRLNERNQSSLARYSMYASMGVAKYDGKTKYIPDFIAQADESLYAVKRARKNRRAAKPLG